MNTNGKWYLVYTYVDTMEAGTFRDGFENEKIPLNAKTEYEIIAEGKIKWADILARENAKREKQKNTYVHPPRTAFDGAKPNPHIIYEILL